MSIHTLGIEALTEFQAKVRNAVRNSGADLVLHAKTGSGKTIAYLWPLIEQHQKALIIQPNAALVDQTQRLLGKFKVQDLFTVTTPRRIDLGMAPAFVIIDEADLSLSASSLPPKSTPTSFLKSHFPLLRPRFLFAGATFPFEFRQQGKKASLLAELSRFSPNLTVINDSETHRPLLPDENQHFSTISRDSLVQTIWNIACGSQGSCMIFVENAEKAVNLHSSLKRMAPEIPIYTFPDNCSDCSGKYILIGTDAMSRGIDLPTVSTIIHQSPPANYTDYLHRLGRLNRLSSIHSIRNCHSFCISFEKEQQNAFLRSFSDNSLNNCLFSRNRSLRRSLRRRVEPLQ